MHPMDDDMELEELASLKELARHGMAQDFKSEMGLGGGEDETMAPVPGAESGEDGLGEAKMEMKAEGELPPEVLAQVVEQLKAKLGA